MPPFSRQFKVSPAVIKKIVKLTLFAIALSVPITAVIMYANGSSAGMPLALAIAVLCPVLVAPPVIYLFHRQGLALAAAHADLRIAHQQLFEIHLKLQNSHKELKHKASHDAMTGLANRETFLTRLSALRRKSDVGYLLMIDADNFKLINDEHGHDAGDRVLLAVAQSISSSIRTDDFAARIGGEEFAIILQGTSQEDATVVAERVRASVEQISVATAEGVKLRVTVSIGGSAFGKSRRCDQIMRAADLMLYQAKNSGRNQVCLQFINVRAA